jgi:LmbE family N-acetylglucosaminyl deacetylase
MVQRRLTPANPKLALRHGLSLTRGPRRVRAVSAHQDDLELFAAGTLRLLALAGSSITAVIATGGDQQYTSERTLDQIREQEERDAGTILGYDDIRFLRFTDLNLAHNPRFQPDLEAIWNQVRPDLVFSFDPTAPYRSAVHPDHLAVGRAVLNISRALGDDAPDIVFYGSRDPNVLVDISQVVADKTEAIRAHRSQLTGWKRYYNLATRLQTRLAGRPVSVKYAEPLRCLGLRALRDESYLENWAAQEPVIR